jgi:ferritin-like metal-binding protein YciE
MTDILADDVWRDVFVTGLKNAHAMEHEALALMDRQIERARNFQEIADMLQQHRGETELQIERLDTLLASLDEKPSGLKDAAMSMGGTMAALGHSVAGDEVLKNAFANFAFENFESAAYQGLIILADRGGYSVALDPLQQTLEEETRMARWVQDSLPLVIDKHLELRRLGENASR